jgi:hypothetical protein
VFLRGCLPRLWLPRGVNCAAAPVDAVAPSRITVLIARISDSQSDVMGLEDKVVRLTAASVRTAPPHSTGTHPYPPRCWAEKARGEFQAPLHAEALWAEVQLLERVLHRNRFQHRGSCHGRALTRLQRALGDLRGADGAGCVAAMAEELAATLAGGVKVATGRKPSKAPPAATQLTPQVQIHPRRRPLRPLHG